MRVLPAAGIVVFAAVFFAPELFGDRIAATANMTRWRPWIEDATEAERTASSHNPDCNLSYYPRRFVLHEAWKEGVIPYWNPYSFCGTPFLADVQAGVLYPPNWFLLPWDPSEQLGLFLFLHVAWGGLGIFFLARRHRVPVGPSFLAGCAFAVNGYFAKHFGQPPFLATAAWLPWVIALSLELRERPDLRRAGLLGLAAALLFLAGQPQVAILGAYAVLIVLVTAAVVRPGEETAQRGRPAVVGLALIGAGGLAALLVSAQLLPTLDLASRSSRAVLPYSTVVSGAFHPVDAVRFVVPEFFGTPLTRDEWSPLFPRGDGFYLRNQLNSVFAGTPLFVLALWGMCAPRTRRRAAPFTALLVASVLVAFGSPLARLAYEVLPGFRFSRIDRAGSLVILAQTIPAALGAADLACARGTARRVFGAAVIGLFAVAFVALDRAGTSLPAAIGAEPPLPLDADTLARVVARTRIAALFAAGTGIAFLLPASRLAVGLPLVLGIVQLFLFASPYRGDRRPSEFFRETPDIASLRRELGAAAAGGDRFVRFGRDLPIRPYALSSILPPSTNVPFRLRDLQGYNALADRRLGESLEEALAEDVFSHGIWAGRRIVAPTKSRALEHPLLDALAVRAAVSAESIVAAGWTPVPARAFALWRNDEALPRIRLATSGRGVSAEEMKSILRRGSFDPKREVVWVGEGEIDGAGDEPGNVETIGDSWNEVSVRTETVSEAILVVADAVGPGWRATIDGREAEILPLWGVVRGVVVPAGRHEIRFRHRPPSFPAGVALSLVGLVLTGSAVALGGRRRRDRDRLAGSGGTL